MTQRSDRDRSQDHDHDDVDAAPAPARVGVPGKSTLTRRLAGRFPGSAPTFTPDQVTQFAVQRAALRALDVDPFADVLDGPALGMDGLQQATDRPGRADAGPTTPHSIAAAGVAGAGGPLPHGAVIQAAFGHHDVSGVRAHTDGPAANANQQLGARAYATGHDVAFATGVPELHTAAHEAAHIIQQRGGVQLADGLGRVGDRYEQHADAVADAVVRGESAVPLLDAMASTGGSTAVVPPIQRDAASTVRGDAVAANGLPRSAEDDTRLRARTRLEMARAKAHEQILKLRAGSIDATDAAITMTSILAGREADVAVLVANYQQVHPPGGPDPADQMKANVRQSLGVGPDERDRARAHDDATMRPIVVAGLDALVGDALEIARALEPDAPELRSMLQTLDVVTQAAVALDWIRPIDLATARDRKFAREACPAEENDDSPNACTLTHAARVEKRQKIVYRLSDLSELFFNECKERTAEFQAAIDADDKLGEMVATFAIDLLISAVTAGAGVPAAKAALAAKAAGMEASEEAKAVGKFAGDLARSLTRTGITRAPRVLGAGHDPVEPRRRTITALDAMAEQFHASVAASVASLETLDDADLVLLEGRLAQYRSDQIAGHVRAFASAYVTQVAPIGLERLDSEHLFEDGFHRADQQAVGRAARIRLPGGRTRLALVDQLTDRPATAAVRRGAKLAAVGLDRALGDHDDALVHGGAYRARQDQWVDATPSTVHFLRWIDDPRMQTLAEADALDLPATAVEDLPLQALVPPSASDDDTR